MKMSTAYQAYAKGGFQVTASTPHAAAVLFFGKFTNKRKCNIIEGTLDGEFFTVSYGLSSKGEWPRSWKGITPSTIHALVNFTKEATPCA